MLRYYIKLGLLSIRRNPILSALMVAAIATGIGACMTVITIDYVMSGNPIPAKSDVLFAVTMDSWSPLRPFDQDQPERAPHQLTWHDAKRLLDMAEGDRQVAMFESSLIIEPVNQDDLPLYDGFIDRINARNLVSFGFLTRLLAKFGPDEVEEEAPAFASTASPLGAEPYLVPPPIQTRGVGRSTVRELGRLQIQQSYSISRPISVSTKDIEETSNFSGVDMFARLTPVSWAGLTSQAVYSPVDNKFIFANVGANIFDPRPIEGCVEGSVAGAPKVGLCAASGR